MVVNRCGKTLVLSLVIGLLVSACGPEPDAQQKVHMAQDPHEYLLTARPMDTDPIVIEGCPVSMWEVRVSPNQSVQKDQDYMDFRDRVYVAHCASTTVTSQRVCGKNCRQTQVMVQPDEGSTPAPTATEVIAQALNRLPPAQRAQVLSDVLAGLTSPSTASNSGH